MPLGIWKLKTARRWQDDKLDRREAEKTAAKDAKVGWQRTMAEDDGIVEMWTWMSRR